jgi:ribosomal protein L37AE/L43A
VAEKKAKTAEKSADALQRKHICPSCGSESRVVQYTGFGPRGFFWVCEKACGYTKRTR